MNHNPQQKPESNSSDDTAVLKFPINPDAKKRPLPVDGKPAPKKKSA